ncbi:MAG: NERD domain-containing protein, partial [Pseudomonadales bacterium]|nr:NERD domain-containing protein [Pseudomonadales bacterium]
MMNGIAGLIFSISGSIVLVATILWVINRARKKNKYSPFTEKLLRSPGYSLGKEVDELSNDLTPHLVMLAILPLYYFLIWPQMKANSLIAIAVIFIGYFVLSIKKIISWFNRMLNLRLALDGEVYTGQELNFLMREGAYVYHDIPYQYGNIDHIIVSTGGVFTVETKAVRKPGDAEGKRQSDVVYKEDKLFFPQFVTDGPLKQAQRHADYVHKFLKEKTGYEVLVTPVIAIPGWFVRRQTKNDLLVINPKRGKALRSFVSRPIIASERVAILANQI